MGIAIFPHQTFNSLPKILCMDFEYFVLDMGVLNTYSAKEFAKCEKQFLICSLSRWKRNLSVEKIKKLLNTCYIHQKNVTILGNCKEKRSTLSISNKEPFKVIPIPFLPDPFQIDTEFFSFFREILGTN